MFPQTIPLFRAVRCLCLLLFVTSMGCRGGANSLPLDQPQARQACTEFLTAWKDGKKIEDLKPKIIGRDSDWAAGKKLESFEILPEEKKHGPNLHLTVKRTLKDEKGKTVKQDVEYVVGTSPVITVFRYDET